MLDIFASKIQVFKAAIFSWKNKKVGLILI